VPEPLNYYTSEAPKRDPKPGYIASIFAILFLVHIAHLLFGPWRHFSIPALISWHREGTIPLFSFGSAFTAIGLFTPGTRTPMTWISFAVFGLFLVTKAAVGGLWF